MPGMPWAMAIALGAIVAPPDATAATTILRHVKPPHRILTILEGESLLNDASALMIYRLAIGAIATSTFSITGAAPTFLLAIVGSVVAGRAMAWLVTRVTPHIQDVPTSIIVQFITVFGVWIVAEETGPVGRVDDGVLCRVGRAPGIEITPARMRIPSYAVWETAVFVLNVLAFVFIGLQIRPILSNLAPAVRLQYFWVAGAVLVTVIVVRIAWAMIYYAVVRWHRGRARGRSPGSRPLPSFRGVSQWDGRVCAASSPSRQRWRFRSVSTAPHFPFAT